MPNLPTNIPSQGPSNMPSGSVPGQSTPPSVVAPPSDSSAFGGGYDASNVILAGFNNKIEDSRRCSILQGTGNIINGLYNTHIIGNFIEPTINEAFFVGCHNGMFVKGDVVAFSSSDKRLKDNISILIDPLEKVLRLDAVEFDWNNKQETYTGHDIGLIAQQVEEVAPELVTTRSTGYKAVKYEKLTALLVGAIKEQQKQIEFLEKRISSLERRSCGSSGC